MPNQRGQREPHSEVRGGPCSPPATHLCVGIGGGHRVTALGLETDCERCAARAREWQQASRRRDAKAIVLARLRTMPEVEPLEGLSEAEVEAAVSRTIGRLAGRGYPLHPDVQASVQEKVDAWRTTGAWPLENTR